MGSANVVKTPSFFTLFHSTTFMMHFLPVSATSSIGSFQQYTDCNISVYYGSMLDDSMNMDTIPPRKSLHDLIQFTHRTSLPYTSYGGGQKDVWDALSSLDSDESGEAVWLIYGDRWTPVSPRDDGTCSSWNREHLWPRSRGVGEEGYDNTDLHHLRPADCNVNAARSNRLFGSCGTGSPSSTCTIPAHSEAANDTERDSVSFLPPERSRGDIARAILYMDLRYDGDDNGGEASKNVMDLIVTDCPGSYQMGYLSQLLEWHAADPPDEREKKRNNEVCEYWQGNRNPFVDFPHLVQAYFGSPKALTGDGLGYNCFSPMTSTPSPTKSPGEPTFDRGTCLEMQQGDVAIIGIQSTDPDMIFLLALVDLPAGGGLYITDNAWTGFELKSNEGVKKLTIPAGGISSGTMFGYSAHSGSSLLLGNSWTSEGGSFALSVSGDNVIMYCLNGDGSKQFLYAAIYQSDWLAENPDPSAFSSNKSALPAPLPENCAVSLPESKTNLWYHGSFSGSKNGMLTAISDRRNWMSDDAELYGIFTQFPSMSPSSSPTNAPIEPGSCGGMQGGDVAIVGIKSLDPDMILLLALSDLPGEAAIFITDNAWTGFALKSNEGVKKLNVPRDGISLGTLFGYDASTETFLYLGDSWVGENGRLALSTNGDNIMVYCIEGGSIKFLYAAIYQNNWSTENSDPSVFSTSESALPKSLPTNAAVSLMKINKNYWYHGSYKGNKPELLVSIADQNNWSTDDDSS